MSSRSGVSYQDMDPHYYREALQHKRRKSSAEPSGSIVSSNSPERSERSVVYDEDAIYVAFWCHDTEPDKIQRQLVRRDRWSESDMVSLRLDPYHDHQTGYMFTLSASGGRPDKAGKKRSCTVVATLLTFWPPCPPLRTNFSSKDPGRG